MHQVWQWPLRRGDTRIAVLAHRGRGTTAADNTLGAFSAALEGGADGVELDVRRSADGLAVVHHDPEVPGLGPLHLLRRADLPPWLPSLEEALVCCHGAMVDVEVKASPLEAGFDPTQQLASDVAEIVDGALAAGGGPDAAFVSSFWPATLEAVHRARPELALGQLVAPGIDTLSGLEQALAGRASVLLPMAAACTADLVEAAHRRQLAVIPWAVDSDAEIVAAQTAAVDAVITDHPTRALAIVRSA